MERKNFIAVLFFVSCVFLFFLRSKKEYSYPSNFQIENFSVFTQPDSITCGPTSVLMVLRKYGIDTTIDAVKKETLTEWFSYDGNHFGMTSPDYIPIALKNFGVPSKLIFGDLAKLKHYVSQNKPIIVLVRSGKNIWHYIVVIGYDRESLTIADPGFGLVYKVPEKMFLESWAFNSTINGKQVVEDCTVCKGSGHWTKYNLGPLSYCEICNGTGKQTDFMGNLVRNAEVYPFTMFIPDD
jgi:hypothetical protein